MRGVEETPARGGCGAPCGLITLFLLLIAANAEASEPLQLRSSIRVEVLEPDHTFIREEFSLRADFIPTDPNFSPDSQELRLVFQNPAPVAGNPRLAFLLQLPGGSFLPQPVDGSRRCYLVPDAEHARQRGVFVGVVEEQVGKPGEPPGFVVNEELTGQLSELEAALCPGDSEGWSLRIHGISLGKVEAPTPWPDWQTLLGSAIASSLTIGGERWDATIRRARFEHADPGVLVDGQVLTREGPGPVQGNPGPWAELRLSARFAAGQAVFDPAAEALRIEFDFPRPPQNANPLPLSRRFLVSVPAGSMAPKGSGYALPGGKAAPAGSVSVGIIEGQSVVDLTPLLAGLELRLLSGPGGRWTLQLDARFREAAQGPNPGGERLPVAAGYAARVRIGDDTWSARMRELEVTHLPEGSGP